jgi:WD40 repeat protein
MLATDGAEGTARIWDVAAGAERAVLRGHEGTVYRPAFSPDGRLLVTGGQNGTVHVWDVATGWERNALRGHAGAVFATDFSPDGRLLASAGEDGTVRVASGAERSVLSGGSGALYGVAFSPGGHLLAACGADTTVLEEVEPPGALPYVTPDAIGEMRRDLLGITGDVEALANLIAARDTAPPLRSDSSATGGLGRAS